MVMAVYEALKKVRVENAKSVHLKYDDQIHHTYVTVTLKDGSERNFKVSSWLFVNLFIKHERNSVKIAEIEFPREIKINYVDSVEIDDVRMIVFIGGKDVRLDVS